MSVRETGDPGAVYPDPHLAPWPGFALAAAAAVEHLDAHLGLDLWLVTAVEGGDQVVVAAAGHWAELAAAGTVFPWESSFCLRMTQQQGPTVAPDVREVAAYAQAATGVLALVRAYVGVPLVDEEGVLFGTLCAFAGDPQPATLTDTLPLVRLVGQMLSTVLAREQFARARSQEAAAAQALAGEDPLTGLRNTRGWTQALEHEQERSRRFGSTPSVLVVEVDGLDDAAEARDDVLVRCAAVVAATVRPVDVVARVAGLVFGVLAVECDPVGTRALARRLRVELRSAGVTASVGTATRRAGERLDDTWARAREEVERDRRRRRRLPPSARGPSPLPEPASGDAG